MQIPLLVGILLCVAGLLVGAVIAGFVAFKSGVSHRKKTAEAAIGSAEAEAERIMSEERGGIQEEGNAAGS